jgi:hypothetical protein
VRNYYFAPMFMAACAVTVAAHAQESFTQSLGGKGGQQFILRCPAGTALTGVSALTGAYVNSIGPICNGRPMSLAGGKGNPRSASCPDGSVVGRMEVGSLRSENHLLKAVGLWCLARGTQQETAVVPLDTPGAYTTPKIPIKGLYWAPGYPHGVLNCGAQAIIGLQGRAGAAVDALGLVCGKVAR